MGKRTTQRTPRTPRTHTSVMTREVVELFAPLGEGLVLDATFGRGGHARALLQETSCRIIALDCDPEAIAYGKNEPFFQAHAARFSLAQGFFAQSVELLGERNLHSLDGVLFDYGLSSPQLDNPQRGFSFQQKGPLDMRMALAGESAQEFLERASEEDLTQALYLCGEQNARRIARALAEARAEGSLPQDTLALATLVRAQNKRYTRIDAATKTFMALRIAVNFELAQIAQGLQQADRLLRTGGRMVAIAFHSLEDRIVKRQFSTWTGHDKTGEPRHRASPQDLPSESNDALLPSPARAPYRALVRRPRRASALEVSENPRARSARLRAVEKIFGKIPRAA